MKTTDKQRSEYEGAVVRYNGKLWLCWSLNAVQKCQLLSVDGIKYSGTPNIENVIIVYKLKTIIRNGIKYYYSPVQDQFYSGATGHKIKWLTSDLPRIDMLKSLDELYK